MFITIAQTSTSNDTVRMRRRHHANICVKWKTVFHSVEIIIVVNSDHRLLHSTRINTNGSFYESLCFHCNSFQYQAIKPEYCKKDLQLVMD
jgi:hypothetical protein